MLVLVCPGGLADLPGHGPAGTQVVAVDGKSARGSRTDAAPAAHLLSAVTAAGRVVSQPRGRRQDQRVSVSGIPDVGAAVKMGFCGGCPSDADDLWVTAAVAKSRCAAS
ncbi:hypothetical protein ACIQ9Q_39975 [Streptomyces sp. NPDC094438]|uniref:hypothetical protein n=1 Tax=Streptomyces sp. NPDC094438 TaxID=3366061 RepID=UPI003825625B